MPPGEKLSGVHSETHQGERLSVKNHPTKQGYLQSSINGHVVGTPIGRSNKDAVKELDSLKGTVNNAKERPNAYINGDGETSYGMKLPKAEGAPAAPSRQRVQASRFQPGDIIARTGDKVIKTESGVSTPHGKIEVILERPDGSRYRVTWGKTTEIGVNRG